MENLSGTLDREALDRVAPVLGDEARQARMHELRREILALAGEYAILQTAPPVFVAGQTPLNFAGRVYDDREMVNLVGASLDFWLTAGRCAHQLERRLARYVGVEHCLLVNSGFQPISWPLPRSAPTGSATAA